MIDKPKRITHEIIHPVGEDYEICYMVIMIIENGKVVQKTMVEIKSMKIYAQFKGGNSELNYTFSIN